MRNKLLVLATVCALAISSVTVSAASVNSPEPDKHYTIVIGGEKIDDDTDKSVNVGEGGSISISTGEVVKNENGDNVYKYVLEAEPKDGYEFQYWIVNGEIVNGSTLTIIPTDDTEIVAVFKNTATGELIYSDGRKDDNGSTSPKTGYPIGSMALLFLASGAVLVYSRKKVTE